MAEEKKDVPLTRAEKREAQRAEKTEETPEMPKVEVVVETGKEKRCDKSCVLKDAKKLGLFVKNKSLSRYEINLSVNEYEAL